MQELYNLLKKNSQICKKATHRVKESYKRINLYFEDEPRFGLFTQAGK